MPGSVGSVGMTDDPEDNPLKLESPDIALVRLGPAPARLDRLGVGGFNKLVKSGKEALEGSVDKPGKVVTLEIVGIIKDILLLLQYDLTRR